MLYILAVTLLFAIVFSITKQHILEKIICWLLSVFLGSIVGYVALVCIQTTYVDTLKPSSTIVETKLLTVYDDESIYVVSTSRGNGANHYFSYKTQDENKKVRVFDAEISITDKVPSVEIATKQYSLWVYLIALPDISAKYHLYVPENGINDIDMRKNTNG